MLILEKIRNKYNQIWITVDGEKRDTKFDCRLKGENQTVLHSNRPGPALSLAMDVCSSSYHLRIQTFLINALPCLPPSIPFSGFHLPRLRRSLVSVACMARKSKGRFCKEEAPRPRPRPSSSVLSAAPAKSFQRAAPMRLPQRSMEEVGSSSARGRKSYTRARAKLADSVGVFDRQPTKGSTRSRRMWSR
jgi:hypothetical protein